jgi:hypothetical protein
LAIKMLLPTFDFGHGATQTGPQSAKGAGIRWRARRRAIGPARLAKNLA